MNDENFPFEQEIEPEANAEGKALEEVRRKIESI